MFMHMQCYFIKDNVLYQDNQSTILMLKNGRNSCTGNSRHIHIRYFFVKDRIDKKEVRVEYCPSLSMLADFFTKPLQGQLFIKFKEVLMGWKPITTLKWKYFGIKERVIFRVSLESWLKNIVVIKKLFQFKSLVIEHVRMRNVECWGVENESRWESCACKFRGSGRRRHFITEICRNSI